MKVLYFFLKLLIIEGRKMNWLNHHCSGLRRKVMVEKSGVTYFLWGLETGSTLLTHNPCRE